MLAYHGLVLISFGESVQIRKVKVQKAYVGASLDVIKAKAQQKPEVRAAAREHALRSESASARASFSIPCCRFSSCSARPVLVWRSDVFYLVRVLESRLKTPHNNM